MTLDELTWFVTLARDPHVTRSARRLHVTQPTLTRALARWERDLGVALFDRRGRGLQLNHHGQVLLEHALRALREMATARERIVADASRDGGLVRLAFVPSVAGTLVPDLVSGFRREKPRVRFDLTQEGAHTLLERLRDGAADAVISSPRAIDEQGLRWVPLRTERLALAVPAAAAPTDSTIDLAHFADSPFILPARGLELRRLVDLVCDRAGFAASAEFEATDVTAIEGMVGAGLGVAVVPRPRHGRGLRRIRYLAIDDREARRDLGLVVSDADLPAVVEDFVEFVGANTWT